MVFTLFSTGELSKLGIVDSVTGEKMDFFYYYMGTIYHLYGSICISIFKAHSCFL